MRRPPSVMPCKRASPSKAFFREGIPQLLSILKPVRLCLAAMFFLAVQFSLGMIINLYVTVPASDQHASFVQEVKTAPFALTVHVLVGLLLMAAAIAFVIRAIGTGDW